MKKLAFLNIFIIALLFAACDPMADIYNELDATNVASDAYLEYNAGKTVAPESYVLTDDDYALSSNEDVAKYKNFSSYALPKDFLPEILNAKFFAEDAAAMYVTYNYYESVVADEANAYEISSDDYAAMGQSYSNFSDEDAAEALIGKLFDRITYNNEKGDVKTAFYTLYSTNDYRYIKLNADGTTEVLDYSSDAYELDSADYEFLGQDKYYNFYKLSYAEGDLPDLAAERGHVLPQVYKCLVYQNYYDKYVVYYFNGDNWEVKQSVMAITEKLNFKVDLVVPENSTWWADPALKITLTNEDYELDDATSNYHNFDLRDGKTPGTDRDAFVAMIGAILDANYDAVDDQQYLVTYAYYDGTNGFSTIRVIRTAGVWSEYVEDN